MGVERSNRIAHEIQRELAELIRLEVRDPRVKLVTLTGVELTRDHSHAKVFFTVLGSQDHVEETGQGLQRAAGFLRSSLAHRLSTRTVPELHFAYDESIERGVRLSRMIDEALAPPPPPPKRKPAAKKAAPKAAKPRAPRKKA